MELRGPERADRRVVRRSDVANVRHESVPRIQGVKSAHHAVAHHLRDDRRRGDRGTARVAVHEGAVRRGRRPEPEAVDEASICGRVQIREHGPQAGEIRAVEAVPIDRAHGDDPDADRGRARSDGLVQPFTLLDRDLLRVVQERERTDARAAQRVVVEEDAGDDEWPCERTPPRLIRARDEPHAELAIESEEALAAGSSHAAECTS